MNNGEQPYFTRTAAESSHQLPGDDIYPLQSPYGDIHGLTPPPEEFESFLKEGVPYEHQLRTPFELTTNPPTPPRTEAVSSPSDSIGSDRSSSPHHLPTSSPTTHPSSPGSNAEMDSEMDFTVLCPELVQQGNNDALINGVHDIATSQQMVEEMMGQELEDSQFFDFESAASSPKPAPNTIQAFSPRDQPPQFQSLFSNGQFQPHRTPQMTQRVLNVNGSHSRKRSRVDFDAIADSGMQFDIPLSPPREVKTEGQMAQSDGFPNTENGDFSFQPRQDISDHSLNFTSTQIMHVAASRAMKLIHPDGSTFTTPYSLHIDFPKHMTRTATSNGMEFVVKSRVETQIGIRFALAPIMGAARMRLPKHTIAKIKYLEDVPEGPETVELSAMVVCASAMQNRELLDLACAEAAGVRLQDWIIAAKRDAIKQEHAAKAAQSDKEEGKQKVDFTKPQWGAPVSICEQCMNRERKRAGRKKNKKPDEEQKWAIDEKKRIIVFNTNQIRNFEPCQLGSNAGGIVGAGGLLAETQMRICCYCRHHGEKDGFKVIFTVKDHHGTVLAQSITSTIVITDDHKTTAAGGTAAAIISQQPSQDSAILMPADSTRDVSPQAPPFGDVGRMDSVGSTVPEVVMSPNFNFGKNPSPKPRTNGLSNAGTPARTSPSPAGPQSKRRKNSKVPANLAMTPSDPTQFGFAGASMASYNARSSSDVRPHINHQQSQWTSPLTPSVRPVYRNDTGVTFDPFGNMAWNPTSDNGNMLDQLRSPGQILPQSRNQQQPGFQNNPFKFVKPIPAPADPDLDPNFGSGAVISRVVPGEGTCRGGIEVTVLGRNFVNGMTVVFGDNPAPDTYFYSDSTLLCRLPPNPIPGTVAVYLKNRDREQSQPHSLTIFTYVDDVEKELMALALTVVGMKMKGTESGSSKQIALSILRDSGMSHEAVQARHGNGGSQQLEASLLACLDMIDMDESPHPAKLNHKNRSGQTMLHLACMLGFQKFAAALLARGVNVNTRDKGGYTPLHFAAQYNRTDVIRKLLISRANPGIRTRNGDTAADLGQSNQIVRATRSVQQAHSRQHSRSSSVSSEHRFGSRRSSLGSIATSLPAALRASVDDYYDDSSDNDSSDSDDIDDSSEEDLVDTLRSASRRGSIKDLAKLAVPPVDQAAAISAAIEAKTKEIVASTAAANAEPPPSNPAIMAAAWMEAWREQLTQSFQSLHLNIPTIPAIPAIPTAADYQTIFQNHMARFQNPMAKWKPAVPKEDPTQDYKWSELFNPPPPPAYDELFPEGSNTQANDAKATASEVVPEASSTAVERRPVLPRTPSPTIDLKELHRRIANGDPAMSETLQAEYIAHVRKMKRIESDRRLFFIWIPICILILVLMAFNSGPKALAAGKAIMHVVGEVVREPAAIRQRVGTWLVGGRGDVIGMAMPAPVNVGGG